MLTDTNIRKVKPRDRAFKLFDGGGLYMEINPAGGKWTTQARLRIAGRLMWHSRSTRSTAGNGKGGAFPSTGSPGRLLTPSIVTPSTCCDCRFTHGHPESGTGGSRLLPRKSPVSGSGP